MRQRRRNALDERSRRCTSRWFQRFSSASRSLVGSAKRACCWSASPRFSAGRSRGSCTVSPATIATTSRVLPWRFDSSSIRPKRGSIGRRARSRPTFVSDGGSPPRASRIAPSSRSRSSPAFTPRESGGVRNGNASISPSPSDSICRMTAARFVRRISGSVYAARLREVLLRVQPDRDAGARAAGAAGALVRGRLRDRLDRQPLHLRAGGVAGDARGAAVDHGADAGDGEARLGDVRGEHDRGGRRPACGSARTRGAARRRTAGRRAGAPRSAARARRTGRSARRRRRGSRSRRRGRRARRRPAGRARARRAPPGSR